MRGGSTLWAGVASLACAWGAGADTLTLAPVADTTIYSEGGSLSNGAGEHFFAGKTSIGFSRRGLIRFDLAGLPAGASIQSVTLRLYFSRANGANNPVSLHRSTNSWGEAGSNAPGQEGQGVLAQPGDATWWHRFYDQTHWNPHGGEYVAAPSATVILSDELGFVEWTGAGLASDVNAWLAAPAFNFGWFVIGDESAIGTAKRFSSRQAGDESLRPALIIEYTPAMPGEGACCLPGGGCVVTTSGDCALQGGAFQGPGSACTPDPCGQATGACCLPSGACVVTTSGQCALQGGTYAGDSTMCGMVSCPIPLTPFVDELPRPSTAVPVSGQPGGPAHYVIAMTEFAQQLHRDLPPTRVWGYAGSFPGPTIEASRGNVVTVEWINDLRDDQNVLRTRHVLPVDLCMHGPDENGEVPFTVPHLHGGHVPADSDGHPDFAFPPGQMSGVYTYPNTQPASTMWYHDHAMGITRLNVYMGLAGLYVLRDGVEQGLNLPRGEFEIPLVIQDRSFNPDGSLRYLDHWHEHFFGDFILVNGKVWPYLNVKRGKYRYRVLNGSNSRTYTLALSDGAAFSQIGSDLGLLNAPVAMTSLTLTPGERAEVIIDFAGYAPGTEIVLTNSAPSPFPAGGVGPDVPNVMKFIVGAEAGDTDPLPGALALVEPIPEAEAAVHREFVLRKQFDPECAHDMWMINGLMFDDITEFPRLGTTEVWSWINRSGMTHPMHMHLVAFQVLDRQNFTIQGGQVVPTGPRIPPAPNEQGWKDTVAANPFQITRVIARFEDYAGKFAYHCHILEHEDNEMMRQFESCDPARFDAGPGDVQSCPGATIDIAATALGSSLVFVWRRDGEQVVNGPTGTGSVISGASGAVLRIENAGPADSGAYVCQAENVCSQAQSGAAEVVVLSACCDPDINCDGSADQGDVACMIMAIAGDTSCTCGGDPDFNQDGSADQGDIAAIILVVAGSPCP